MPIERNEKHVLNKLIKQKKRRRKEKRRNIWKKKI